LGCGRKIIRTGDDNDGKPGQNRHVLHTNSLAGDSPI
jgi:hypothetical protein